MPGESEVETPATLIPPTAELGYTQLYLDFVAGNGSAGRFYHAPGLAEVAGSLDGLSFDRNRLAEIVLAQNRAFGASGTTQDRIAQLRDPKAVCVFAGQQAGLFGGPLYSLIKGLAVTRAADLYARQLGRPVIPVFWIAGDDHDFDEVNHTTFLNRLGETCRMRYGSPPPREVPTAEIQFADREELERVLSAARSCLGTTDFTDDLYRLLEQCYTPEDTFVSAFGKLMAAITGDLGLVLFSPGDPEVKRHAIPLFKTVLEKQDELHAVIDKRNREIADAGYHIQVEKGDNAAYMFYNRDGRRPITREDDVFVAGDDRFSREELLGHIEAEPERFSPDVITRPVFQSYLFPTVSQKGGPSEIAYLAQINPVFDVFDLPAPVHVARPTLTLIEKRFEKQMDSLEITFDDLTGDIEQAINRVLEKTFPKDLQADFEKLRRDVRRRFEEFAGESMDFDPSLKDNALQTGNKIDYQLNQFEEKVFKHHKKKSQETRDRIYRIWYALYPNRGFQERSLNICYFLSRYGTEIVKFMYDHMDSEEHAHQLLHLSEFVNE